MADYVEAYRSGMWLVIVMLPVLFLHTTYKTLSSLLSTPHPGTTTPSQVADRISAFLKNEARGCGWFVAADPDDLRAQVGAPEGGGRQRGGRASGPTSRLRI